MQLPLQIIIRDMPPTAALEAHIRDRTEKLEEYFAPLISCRILLEMVHQHQPQGNHFNVRIDLGVPGNEIVVNLHHHQDLHLALRDAFDIAKRQLEDYAHRLQRETKPQVAEQI